MTWKPSRNSAKPTGPRAIASGVPTAESTEYRPPTQSQKPKAFSGSIPKAATLSRAVETATKCLPMASNSASADSSMALTARSSRSSQSRAIRALVRVSKVVKVLEATMNRVVSGSSPLVFSTTSVGSMLETKRHSRCSATYGFSASYTITGPRSEPPIPIFTTVAIGFPLTPTHSPERTRSAKA